jgi:hypothetical protein
MSFKDRFLNKVKGNENKQTVFADFTKERYKLITYIHLSIKSLIEKASQEGKDLNKKEKLKRYDFPRHPRTATEQIEKWVLEGAQRDGYVLSEEQEQLLNRFL